MIEKTTKKKKRPQSALHRGSGREAAPLDMRTVRNKMENFKHETLMQKQYIHNADLDYLYDVRVSYSKAKMHSRGRPRSASPAKGPPQLATSAVAKDGMLHNCISLCRCPSQ